jgi:hypothetical protein
VVELMSPDRREWFALIDTFLKSTLRHSRDLPDDQKKAAPKGTCLRGVIVGEVDKYWIVADATVDDWALEPHINLVHKDQWKLMEPEAPSPSTRSMHLRIVSVTRIFNEDDIVEAFVRHNAHYVSHMVFLDNGSNDRTVEILQALKAEGVDLTVFQSLAGSFEQPTVNTWLYRVADQMHHADWVVYLDADEFIAIEGGRSLEDAFEQEGAGQAVSVPLFNFAQTVEDDSSELVVPIRMRWRHRAKVNVPKVFVHGGYGLELSAAAGNHTAFLNGHRLPAPTSSVIELAHYPRRDGLQNLRKSVVGWLKVLAAGQSEVAKGSSSHYRGPFELLRDRPHELLLNHGYLEPELDRPAVEYKPLEYRGGPLCYTEPHNPVMKTVTTVLHYAELLAQRHGRLLQSV